MQENNICMRSYEQPKLQKVNTSSLELKNNYKLFNPITHFPPSFDIHGYQIPKNQNERYNILTNKNIVIPWEQNIREGSPMTRAKVLEKRRQERIPDISYDLDGDGFVGGRDYVISKHFDVENKGKLNPEEKKKALEAIRNGFEQNFMWDLSGNRVFRVLQKRGKIIDSEDFLPLQETYPRHPLSDVVPKNNIRTLSSLKSYRRSKNIEDYMTQQSNREKKNKINLSEEHYSGTLNQPKFTSVSQIKDNLRKELRKKVGLSEEVSDINDKKKLLSLNYIYDPIHKTKGDLKKEILKETHQISDILNSRKHKTAEERLRDREDQIFDNLYNQVDGLTYKKLKEQKKNADNEYNIKHFAPHSIGVHGHELPKFYDTEIPFWEINGGYCENPLFKSQVELLENRKFWKHPEELYLSEHKTINPDELNFDPYNRIKILKKKNILDIEKNNFDKIHNINFYKDFDPKICKPVVYDKNKKHAYKWTDLMHKFSPQNFKEGRLFESLEKQDNQKTLNDEEMENKMKEFLKQKEITKHTTKRNSINNIKNKPKPVELINEKNYLFKKFGENDRYSELNTCNTCIRSKGF